MKSNDRFINLSIKALEKNNNSPMTINEIWDSVGHEVKTSGKTPKNSLASIIHVNANKNKFFKCIGSNPKKFILINYNGNTCIQPNSIKPNIDTKKPVIEIELSDANLDKPQNIKPNIFDVKIPKEHVSIKQEIKPLVSAYTPLDRIPNNLIPKSLRTNFSLNESYFEKFTETLRIHQKEAVDTIRSSNIGQINIPTGTGKSYIQKHVIVEDMIKKTKESITGVYVIAAHRLILCTQLFDGVLDLIINCGIKCDMIYLGSDRYNFDSINTKYKHLGFSVQNIEGEQTTSSSVVKECVDRAIKNNRHVIIVSTYNSFDRLSKLNNIDIVTFDEAHTTTNEFFTDNINKVKENIKRQYFFTATRRVLGEDGGQNNEQFYGKVLYEMSPSDAIDIGEIVRPRFHLIKCNTVADIDVTSNKDLMVRTVTEAFSNHKSKVAQYSSAPERIGAKLLTTVNGLNELHTIHGDEEFQKFCTMNNIKTFAFSSDEGEFFNFKRISRQKALDAMMEMEDTEDAIFFHYDILTEGIDLPAITGVLLLRDLPTSKLLQNVGRGARLLKYDRQLLYSNQIRPNDLQKMIKPYCWIILPEYLKTLSGGVRIKDMILALREMYNIEVELMGESDQALSEPEEFLPSTIVMENKVRKQQETKLTHAFEKVLIDTLIEDVMNSPSPIDRLHELIKGLKPETNENPVISNSQ